MKKLVLSLIVLAILVGGGIGLGIYLNNRDNTATATVQMDLNPSAEFVLNSQNEVITVNYLNEDANIIYANIEVVGKNIEDIAKEFTQKAIESGYNINYNSDQNVISLTINCGSTEQANSLKENISNKINEAFDENGIFGRAIAEINTQTTNLVDKYKQTAENLHIDLEEFANKTEAEILEIIKNYSKKYEGISAQEFEKLAGDQLNSTLQVLKQNIAQAETNFENLQAQLQELLNNAFTDESVKEELNARIETARKGLETKIAQFEEVFDSFVNQLKQNSQEFLNNCKTLYQNKVNAVKDAYEQHLEQFEANKEAKIAEIKAWRESLEA